MNFEGFDFSYIEDAPAEKQQFYWVGLFYFLAKTAMDKCGDTGEEVIRKGVREYGRERGQRMRKISDVNGRPADLLTLFENYDLMSDPRFVHPKEGRILTAEVKKSITERCPDAEMWGRLPDGLHIGSVFCEEVHHQIYGGYDPAIQVNLCETLTNGGHQCRFHIYCRKANQKEYPLPQYVPQTWEDFGNDMVASIHSMFCLMYIKMGRVIKDKLGEEVLADAIRRFCCCRGKRMRLLHENKKIPVSPASFLQEGDLFLDHRFTMTAKYLNTEEVEVFTKRNLLYEVSASYQSEDLAKLYEKISYEWLLKGYEEAFRLGSAESGPNHIHLILLRE